MASRSLLQIDKGAVLAEPIDDKLPLLVEHCGVVAGGRVGWESADESKFIIVPRPWAGRRSRRPLPWGERDRQACPSRDIAAVEAHLLLVVDFVVANPLVDLL